MTPSPDHPTGPHGAFQHAPEHVVGYSSADIADIAQQSRVTVSASGLQGGGNAFSALVTDAYVTALVQVLESYAIVTEGGVIGVSGNGRADAARIASDIGFTIEQLGYTVVNLEDAGRSALAYWSLKNSAPALFVTGANFEQPDGDSGISWHIPSTACAGRDLVRTLLRQRVRLSLGLYDEHGARLRPYELPPAVSDAIDLYRQRYLSAFAVDCLSGLQVGVLLRSGTNRLQAELYEALGAQVTRINLPRDLPAEKAQMFLESDPVFRGADLIVGTDESDLAPVIFDRGARWLAPPQQAALAAAKWFGAQTVVIDDSVGVSDEMFAEVYRAPAAQPCSEALLRISSLASARPIAACTAGGYFLLGSDVRTETGLIEKLPAPDTTLVHLAVMLYAKNERRGAEELIKSIFGK